MAAEPGAFSGTVRSLAHSGVRAATYPRVAASAPASELTEQQNRNPGLRDTLRQSTCTASRDARHDGSGDRRRSSAWRRARSVVCKPRCSPTFPLCSTASDRSSGGWQCFPFKLPPASRVPIRRRPSRNSNADSRASRLYVPSITRRRPSNGIHERVDAITPRSSTEPATAAAIGTESTSPTAFAGDITIRCGRNLHRSASQ